MFTSTRSIFTRNFVEKLLHSRSTLWISKTFETRANLHTSKSVEVSYKKHGATVTETQNSRQENSPVVVLLGWNGAQDKHLAKYSGIFTEKNYGTVRVTANSFDTFCRLGTKVKKNSFKVLDVLEEMNCENRPVILYAFSQGGGAVFYHMMQAITTPQSEYYGRMKVAGTIFDSCPLKLDISGKERLLKSITDRMDNPIVKTVVWYGLGIVAEVAVHLSATMPQFMDDMKASSLKCRQLVLYSKADLYSPHEDITDYISARIERGVNITFKCWDNSAHVSHFKEHTDEYLKLVNDFVHDCLHENRKN